MKWFVYSVVVGALWGQSVAPFAPNPSQTMVRHTRCLHTIQSSQSSLPEENAIEFDSSPKEDPIKLTLNQWRDMDTNALINNGVLIAVTLAVLFKISTINLGMTRGWTAAEMAFRVPIDNWASYSAILNAAPIQTKAVTSATVYTIGDLIAQRTEGASTGEIDRVRTLRSMLAGLLAHGPMSHYWYEINENLFENVLHCTAWWSFFPKVILDQTTWGPFWNNTYILILGLMKRDSLETIWGDIKRTTIPLIVSGLKLWPLAHCVTYGLVPVENRLLWVDFVEIIWVTILATQAAGGDNLPHSDGHVTTNGAMTNVTATGLGPVASSG